jgi:hypothetical protein
MDRPSTQPRTPLTSAPTSMAASDPILATLPTLPIQCGW